MKTQNLEDYPKLIDGLKKLNKSDPSIEVYAQENGDVVISTCGEVHLERCIRDLEDTLSKVKIIYSEPLISFRETITYENFIEPNNNKTLLGQEKKEGIKEEDAGAEEDSEEEERKKDYGEDAEIINISEEKPEKDEMRFNEEIRRKKQEQKEAFLKQISQMPKKLDKKNKAKSLMKVNKINLINLSKRTNIFEATTPNKRLGLTVRAIGLKFEFAQYLEKQSSLLRKCFYDTDSKQHHAKEASLFMENMLKELEHLEFNPQLITLIKTSLVSFGPKSSGPNMLLIKGVSSEDCLFSYGSVKPKPMEPFQEALSEEVEEEKTNKSSTKSTSFKQAPCSNLSSYKNQQLSPQDITKALMAGFEMAVSSGPLCEEPLMGVCFIVEGVKNIEPEEEKITEAQENTEVFKDLYGPLTGQIMGTMKEACHESFLGAGPRLVEGVYECNLLTDSTFYGKSYEVLNKRRACILNESLNENSNIFNITAHLPLQESFGFYSELMNKTQGRVNAQLTFDTWKILDIDPFFCPQTEEVIFLPNQIIFLF